MTVYELREKHKQAEPNTHFWDKDTLRFFGEKISDMEVMHDLKEVIDCLGEKHLCYALLVYQRNAPEGVDKHRFFYFDSNTFESVLA